jgi:hypothetical protein
MYFFGTQNALKEPPMEHKCPICQQPTFVDKQEKSHADYICRTDQDQHVYMYRFKNNEVSQLKVRITEPDGSKLYFKVLYDQDRSEVWTKTNDHERINIGKAFVPDFSDLDKLKGKLKMYLLFS